jgi:hypothetical protein
VVSGDFGYHLGKGSDIVEMPKVVRRGRKGEGVGGPGEESQVFETAGRGPEAVPSPAADEAAEFPMGVCRNVAWLHLAAPGDHLVGGIPDAQVEQADAPRAVEPPEEAELLDGEGDISSQRFFGPEAEELLGCVRCHDRQASRMGADEERASTLPVRAVF